MNAKRPRKLDLNAPLISTRRSNAPTIEIPCTNSPTRAMRNGAIFMGAEPWEAQTLKREFQTRRFAPSETTPIRWQEDAMSDGIDLFSLAPSLNPSEEERPDHDSARGDTDLDSDMGCNNNNGSSSPNFMIQRFLPAATALAASSLSDLSNNRHPMTRYPGNNDLISGMERSCVPRVAGQALSTSKGCGFQLLFPWRAKRRLSTIKSTVRRVHPSFKLQIGPRNR